MSLAYSDKVAKEVPKHIAGNPDPIIQKLGSQFGPNSDFLLFYGLSEYWQTWQLGAIILAFLKK